MSVMSLMLTWGGLIAFGFVVANFFGFGIPVKVIAVRASMGKKILVHVKTMTGYYYRTGVLDGDFLVFRGRNDKRSEKRRIDLANAERLLAKPVLFRAWGVVNVAIDEATSAVFAVDLTTVQPHDPKKVDGLIQRAIMAPKIQDKKDIVIIVLVVLVLLLLVYVAFKTGQTNKIVQSIQAYQNVTMIRGPVI